MAMSRYRDICWLFKSCFDRDLCSHLTGGASSTADPTSPTGRPTSDQCQTVCTLALSRKLSLFSSAYRKTNRRRPAVSNNARSTSGAEDGDGVRSCGRIACTVHPTLFTPCFSRLHLYSPLIYFILTHTCHQLSQPAPPRAARPAPPRTQEHPTHTYRTLRKAHLGARFCHRISHAHRHTPKSRSLNCPVLPPTPLSVLLQASCSVRSHSPSASSTTSASRSTSPHRRRPGRLSPAYRPETLHPNPDSPRITIFFRIPISGPPGHHHVCSSPRSPTSRPLSKPRRQELALQRDHQHRSKALLHSSRRIRSDCPYTPSSATAVHHRGGARARSEGADHGRGAGAMGWAERGGLR